MKKILATALAFVFFAGAAIAESKPLTNLQALNLLAALSNLDGHIVIVKQNGQDVAVLQPWEFKNALLRLRIKRDIKTLTTVSELIEETRKSLLAAASANLPKDKDGKAVDKDGKPLVPDISKEFTDLLNKPVEGAIDLGRIRASELNLNVNDIPSTTVNGLDPIFDDDVSPK